MVTHSYSSQLFLCALAISMHVILRQNMYYVRLYIQLTLPYSERCIAKISWAGLNALCEVTVM